MLLLVYTRVLNFLHIFSLIIFYLEKDKLLDDDNFTYAKIRYLANNGKSKQYIKNYINIMIWYFGFCEQW